MVAAYFKYLSGESEESHMIADFRTETRTHNLLEFEARVIFHQILQLFYVFLKRQHSDVRVAYFRVPTKF